MKKIAILIPLFMLILSAIYAQNQKGDQTLGLSLGFSTTTSNYFYQSVYPGSLVSVNTTSTFFTTNPTYSYFISNNLDIGATVGFGRETDNSTDQSSSATSKQINYNYLGTIYLRRYFLYNNKIGIRVGPYFTYQYTHSAFTYTPNTGQANNNFTGNFYRGGLSADFVYYPVSKIGLAVNLGNLSYIHNKYGIPPQTNSDSFSLQLLNNNLMLSAFYVFSN